MTWVQAWLPSDDNICSSCSEKRMEGNWNKNRHGSSSWESHSLSSTSLSPQKMAAGDGNLGISDEFSGQKLDDIVDQEYDQVVLHKFSANKFKDPLRRHQCSGKPSCSLSELGNYNGKQMMSSNSSENTSHDDKETEDHQVRDTNGAMFTDMVQKHPVKMSKQKNAERPVPSKRTWHKYNDMPGHAENYGYDSHKSTDYTQSELPCRSTHPLSLPGRLKPCHWVQEAEEAVEEAGIFTPSHGLAQVARLQPQNDYRPWSCTSLVSAPTPSSAIAARPRGKEYPIRRSASRRMWQYMFQCRLYPYSQLMYLPPARHIPRRPSAISHWFDQNITRCCSFNSYYKRPNIFRRLSMYGKSQLLPLSPRNRVRKLLSASHSSHVGKSKSSEDYFSRTKDGYSLKTSLTQYLYKFLREKGIVDDKEVNRSDSFISFYKAHQSKTSIIPKAWIRDVLKRKTKPEGLYNSKGNRTAEDWVAFLAKQPVSFLKFFKENPHLLKKLVHPHYETSVEKGFRGLSVKDFSPTCKTLSKCSSPSICQTSPKATSPIRRTLSNVSSPISPTRQTSNKVTSPLHKAAPNVSTPSLRTPPKMSCPCLRTSSKVSSPPFRSLLRPCSQRAPSRPSVGFAKKPAPKITFRRPENDHFITPCNSDTIPSLLTGPLHSPGASRGYSSDDELTDSDIFRAVQEANTFPSQTLSSTRKELVADQVSLCETVNLLIKNIKKNLDKLMSRSESSLPKVNAASAKQTEANTDSPAANDNIYKCMLSAGLLHPEGKSIDSSALITSEDNVGGVASEGKALLKAICPIPANCTQSPMNARETKSQNDAATKDIMCYNVCGENSRPQTTMASAKKLAGIIADLRNKLLTYPKELTEALYPIQQSIIREKLQEHRTHVEKETESDEVSHEETQDEESEGSDQTLKHVTMSIEDSETKESTEPILKNDLKATTTKVPFDPEVGIVTKNFNTKKKKQKGPILHPAFKSNNSPRFQHNVSSTIKQKQLQSCQQKETNILPKTQLQFSETQQIDKTPKKKCRSIISQTQDTKQESVSTDKSAVNKQKPTALTEKNADEERITDVSAFEEQKITEESTLEEETSTDEREKTTAKKQKRIKKLKNVANKQMGSAEKSPKSAVEKPKSTANKPASPVEKAKGTTNKPTSPVEKAKRSTNKPTSPVEKAKRSTNKPTSSVEKAKSRPSSEKHQEEACNTMTETESMASSVVKKKKQKRKVKLVSSKIQLTSTQAKRTKSSKSKTCLSAPKLSASVKASTEKSDQNVRQRPGSKTKGKVKSSKQGHGSTTDSLLSKNVDQVGERTPDDDMSILISDFAPWETPPKTANRDDSTTHVLIQKVKNEEIIAKDNKAKSQGSSTDAKEKVVKVSDDIVISDGSAQPSNTLKQDSSQVENTETPKAVKPPINTEISAEKALATVDKEQVIGWTSEVHTSLKTVSLITHGNSVDRVSRTENDLDDEVELIELPEEKAKGEDNNAAYSSKNELEVLKSHEGFPKENTDNLLMEESNKTISTRECQLRGISYTHTQITERMETIANAHGDQTLSETAHEESMVESSCDSPPNSNRTVSYCHEATMTKDDVLIISETESVHRLVKSRNISKKEDVRWRVGPTGLPESSHYDQSCSSEYEETIMTVENLSVGNSDDVFEMEKWKKIVASEPPYSNDSASDEEATDAEWSSVIEGFCHKKGDRAHLTSESLSKNTDAAHPLESEQQNLQIALPGSLYTNASPTPVEKSRTPVANIASTESARRRKILPRCGVSKSTSSHSASQNQPKTIRPKKTQSISSNAGFYRSTRAESPKRKLAPVSNQIATQNTDTRKATTTLLKEIIESQSNTHEAEHASKQSSSQLLMKAFCQAMQDSVETVVTYSPDVTAAMADLTSAASRITQDPSLMASLLATVTNC